VAARVVTDTSGLAVSAATVAAMRLVLNGICRLRVASTVESPAVHPARAAVSSSIAEAQAISDPAETAARRRAEMSLVETRAAAFSPMLADAGIASRTYDTLVESRMVVTGSMALNTARSVEMTVESRGQVIEA